MGLNYDKGLISPPHGTRVPIYSNGTSLPINPNRQIDSSSSSSPDAGIEIEKGIDVPSYPNIPIQDDNAITWSEYFKPSPESWGTYRRKPVEQTAFENVTRDAVDKCKSVDPFLPGDPSDYLVGNIKFPHEGVSENFAIKNLGNVMVRLNYALTPAFIDSGNTLHNAISPKTFQQIGLKESDMIPIDRKVKTAKTGAYLEVLGQVKRKIPLRFVDSKQVFWIRPLIIKGLSMPFNIALPFLRKYKIDQLHSQDSLLLGGNEMVPLTNKTHLPAHEMQEDINSHCIPVYNHKRVHIPAKHSISILARLQDDHGLTDPWSEDDTNIEGLIEPMSLAEGLTAIPTLTKLDKNKLLKLVIMNKSDKQILLENGTRIGAFDPSYNIVEPHDYIPEEEKSHFISAVNQLENKDDDMAMGKPSKWPLDKQKDWLEKTFKLSTRPGLEGKPANIKQAQELLLKHIDIFGIDDQYGATDLLEHEIKIEGDHAPIRQPYKPCSPWLRKSLKDQLDKWLKYKVIEPSKSPWSFRLVSSPKKNGKIRWCLDSRALNEITKKDAYRIPNIEDLLSRPSRHTIFSVVDMCGAFHVIKIKEEDREKTAFSTPFGNYQYIRLCFGLSNAPATFSRLVQQILQDVPIELVYSYLDDTLICGRDLDEHISTMDDVFTKFYKAGLTLQPDKCDLFNDTVEFLGHKLTTDGIAPLARHLDLINNWPEPKSVKDVKSFLGKVTYYRKHIKDLAQIALPLYKLTTRDQREFQFNQEAKESFTQLKKALVTAPVLAFPIFDDHTEFILDTDFSGKAIGGVLSQIQNGKEVVIQYGARKLNEYEQNYSSNKGELLAVIHFMRKWRYFLQDKKFKLRTDHEALKSFKTMEHPRGMIARYLRTLAEFNFDPIFRNGSQHSNADKLSRLANAPSPTPRDEDLLDEKMFAMQIDSTESIPDKSDDKDSPVEPLKVIEEQIDMAKEQKQDETLRLVRQWIEKQEKPKVKETNTMSRDVKCYRDIYETLYLKNDIIWRKAYQGEYFKVDRICVPTNLQTEIIKRVHNQDLAHLKINKTQEKVLYHYYFPNGKRKCEMYVKTCETCKRASRMQRPQRHTYVPSAQEGAPWERLSIDLVGPMPTSPEGNTHLLTVKCCFTRYLEAFPLADTTAMSIADILINEIFCRYGTPNRIHSDQGANLTANLMQELYQILEITPSTTPSYNPKSNPVERSHRELGQMIKALCIENGSSNWQSQTRACVHALNTSRNRSTGFTPYFLLFGKEANTKTDLIFGNPTNYQAKGPVEYVNQTKDRLQVAYQYVRYNLGRAIERSRKAYNDTLKFKPKVGDLVWLCTPRLMPGIGKKLSQFYSGPYRITSHISDVLFRIVVHGNWNSKEVDVVVSIDRISPYLSLEEPEKRELAQQELELQDEFLEDIGELTLEGQQNKLKVTIPEDEPTLPEAIVDFTPVAYRHKSNNDLNIYKYNNNKTNDDNNEIYEEIKDITPTTVAKNSGEIDQGAERDVPPLLPPRVVTRSMTKNLLQPTKSFKRPNPSSKDVEEDKWARREAPKRQINLDPLGDSGEETHTPHKQSRILANDDDSQGDKRDDIKGAQGDPGASDGGRDGQNMNT